MLEYIKALGGLHEYFVYDDNNTSHNRTTKNKYVRAACLRLFVCSFINFIARLMKYLLHLFIFKTLLSQSVFFICFGHFYAFTLFVCVCAWVLMWKIIKSLVALQILPLQSTMLYIVFVTHATISVLHIRIPKRPTNIYAKCIAFFSSNQFKFLLLFLNLFRRASNRFLGDLFSIQCETK